MPEQLAALPPDYDTMELDGCLERGVHGEDEARSMASAFVRTLDLLAIRRRAVMA